MFYHSFITSIIRVLVNATLVSSTPAMDEVVHSRALAGVARVSVIARRDMFEPEAARGNDNTLWKTMESCIRMLSRRYAMSDLSTEHFEIEIRDIWCMFILASKSIDEDHPAQDRLTRIVLQAREYGTLQRAQAGVADAQNAVTSSGRIWSDLPFLVQDVRDAWKEIMIAPSSSVYLAYRLNLTAGIARLAGIGVCGNAFGQCGLEVMNLALESPGALQDRTMLSLAQCWMRYAGDQLLRLSLANESADEAWSIGRKKEGTIIHEDGAASPGFSRDRFLHWKERLAYLKAQANDEMSVEVRCANIITVIWDSFFGHG